MVRKINAARAVRESSRPTFKKASKQNKKMTKLASKMRKLARK